MINVFIPSRTFSLKDFSTYPYKQWSYIFISPLKSIAPCVAWREKRMIDTHVWERRFKLFHYRYLSGRTFEKEDRRGTNKHREGENATGIGSAIALALPRQQRCPTSLFLDFLIDLVTQYTWPHSATSLPATAPFCTTLLHPSRPPTYEKPCFTFPSLFHALLVRAQHRCHHHRLYRHCYHILSSIYAVHPCPPPLSVTRRAHLPSR